MQDEVGHAQLIYRVAEDLGKPREAMFADLVSGKSKFHNVFHYPTLTWGDVGVIAWLVDAAAIISQKALLKCPYAPYARIMKEICWEESFHILHGRDVILADDDRHGRPTRAVQEAVNRWWGPLMQFHGNPIPRDEDPMYVWRIKSQGNEEARQQFLEGYVLAAMARSSDRAGACPRGTRAAPRRLAASRSSRGSAFRSVPSRATSKPPSLRKNAPATGIRNSDALPMYRRGRRDTTPRNGMSIIERCEGAST